MRYYSITVMLFLAFWSCSQGQDFRSAPQQTSDPKTKRVAPKNAQKTQDVLSEKEYDISHSEGVVVANVGDHVSMPLSLYNQDGTLWLTIAFEGVNKEQLAKIPPFALSVDEFLLVFKCVGRTKGYYAVVINEQTGERKYIKSDDTSFKFERWEDHILDCFSVGFNASKNPVKIAPADESKSLPFDKDEFYIPVKIQKDWLKVKWGDEENWKYGWIKWREAGTLLLYLWGLPKTSVKNRSKSQDK